MHDAEAAAWPALSRRLDTVWQRRQRSPAASRAGVGTTAASGATGGLAAGHDAEAPAKDATQRHPGLRVLRERFVRHVLLELEVARLFARRLRDALVDVDGHAFSSCDVSRNGAEVALLRPSRLDRVSLVYPRLQHGPGGVVGDLP